MTAARSQFWSQNTAGIEDVAEEAGDPGDGDGEYFGASLAAANFGRSGSADLAIGVPGELVGGVFRAGAAHVLYGSPTGLTATGDHFWNQNTSGVSGVAERDDRFGQSLAAANFGKSGYADLAVTARREGIDGVPNAGGVHVFYGSSAGVTVAGHQFWSQNTAGIADQAEPIGTAEEGEGEWFGSPLAAADFGRTTHAELVMAVQGETMGGTVLTGAAHVIYGTSTGLTAVGGQFWTQDSPGIIGAAEAGDQFGSALVGLGR